MGAQVGQECVRITASQFCSMIFSVQYRLPSYYKWLLYEADHRQAYRFHRIFLQHLQSGVSGQWLLKSPAHLWTLDTLLETYPDAVIVQTHRDPLKVIASVSALTNHLRRMASDQTSIADCAVQSCEEIVVGLQRGMTLRDSLPPGQVIDVQFADFMRDPFATIRSLYGRLDRELTPAAEQQDARASCRPPRRRRRRPVQLGRHRPGRRAAARAGRRLPAALRRSDRVAELVVRPGNPAAGFRASTASSAPRIPSCRPRRSTRRTPCRRGSRRTRSASRPRIRPRRSCPARRPSR